MMLLKDHLEKKREKKTAFLSLDFENDQKFFSSQIAFIEKLKLEFGNATGYVFIDEIQRKEDAGVFMKGLLRHVFCLINLLFPVQEALN